MCEALRDGSAAAADLGLTWEIVRLLGELGPHCMLLDVTHSPPEHGWLTVSFVTPGTSVEVDASDALNNPLQDLVTALDDVLGGNPASVRWFLEPGAFVLNLVPDGQSVALHLTLCRDSLEGNDEEEHCISSALGRPSSPRFAGWCEASKLGAIPAQPGRERM